ncbi:MAG: protein kinase [Prevotella sp.]|nr:protein kinase [Prevotella sp.]
MDQTLKTKRPDSTVRAEEPVTEKAVNTTLRPEGGVEKSEANDDVFVLKGCHYRNVRCLSDNSGEAQVFLVERSSREYVLKIYYPTFSIKKSLIRIIRMMDMEMIVRLMDFGKTYVEGKNRDYELMEYLKGGTLNDYELHGDFDQFRRIALQAAAALAFCHNNGIIHKDIKPSNFFFRDPEHTQVVLGDFGISSIMGDGENAHRTTQARTPVYAAPEMYNDVIDGVVEITPAVDFYSLGITLHTLWLGENPLSSNERIMMRRKNEGRLPRINELPERVKLIVQGLTAVNPQNRWGYDEVEKWFLGESPKVDVSSPILRYKTFVVDPEHNVVADNVHELIPLLLEYDRLAMGYLYGGRLTTWLEQCGNVKLSTVVKDIVQNKYPADQRAGLMASVYAMEPTYPYQDIKDNLCDDVHSVAISMLSYVDEYAVFLRNKNDRLWLYLESHTKLDIDHLRAYFEPRKDFDGRVAVLRTAYEIDKSIPFLSKYPSSTLPDIVKAFGHQEMTEDDWKSLTDGRLLSWMYSHEDHMACEALRIMTNGQKYSRSLAYKVLYNVYRDAPFDLRGACTPEQVGMVLRDSLIKWQSMDDATVEQEIADYADPDGRFCYFAQLHGWFEQMNEATRNFDMKSEENRERISAYDMRTAAYRMCRILGVDPVYVLPDGTRLSDGKQVNDVPKSLLKQEVQNGSLSQWLSVWYHEDPYRDFSEPYSYERTLEEWVLKLGEIDNRQLYYRRYMSAKEETSRRFSEVRQSYIRAKGKEKIWRYLFYALCAVWVLAIIFVGISDQGRFYLLKHAAFTIGLPVGGMSALIVATRAYFRGYGFVFSCLWGALGAMSSVIPIWTLKYINHSHYSLFIPTIILLTLLYMVVCHFTDFRTDKKDDKTLINTVLNDDIKTELLEPLYYTFKTKSYKYKSSKFGVLDDVQNQVHSVAGESVLHYILWSLLVVILLLEMFIYSPKLMNVANPDLEHWSLSPVKVEKKIQKDIE